MILNFDPLKLPPDILEALGLIIATSSQTERVIEMAICGCLKVSANYGPAITAHMTAPLRDHVLRSVAQLAIDDLDTLDELDQLLDDIKVAIAKRNLYVHNPIGREETRNKFYAAKIEARGEVDSESIPISAQQIKADAIAILEKGLKLMTFLMRFDLLAKFPPLSRIAHKKQRRRERSDEKSF